MITLWINHYTDPDIARNDELQFCLQRNLDNPHIDRVYCVCDNDEMFPDKHAKIVIWGVDERPTFDKFFDLINNENPQPGDVNIIANSDIYFDHTVLTAHDWLKPDDPWFLTRYNVENPKQKAKFYGHKDSQDSFWFKGRIKDIADCSFTLGLPASDNAIADRAWKSGYNVINPSLSILSYHLHNSGVQNYDKVADTVAKPHKLLEITKLR